MVEEKFVDYEKDLASHIEQDLSKGQIKSPLQYSLTSLEASPGDTISVAFFIYITDSQGVRLVEVRTAFCEIALLPPVTRCFDELSI